MNCEGGGRDQFSRNIPTFTWSCWGRPRKPHGGWCLCRCYERTTPDCMSVSLPLDPMSTWHRHSDVCSVKLPLCPRTTFNAQVPGHYCWQHKQTALNLANAESPVFWASALRNETECHSNSKLSSVLNILLYAVITPSLFPPSPSQLWKLQPCFPYTAVTPLAESVSVNTSHFFSALSYPFTNPGSEPFRVSGPWSLFLRVIPTII